MADSALSFVERLFADHRGRLLAFFRRRLRTQDDAPDLAQEVYLRMLRVRDPEAIRNPELYLYTVAGNLVKEHAVIDHRLATTLDIHDERVELPPAATRSGDDFVDDAAQNARLREALAALSPKCRATVVLQYRYGMNYRDIAERLGISTNMVKKYHSQAIVHCRRWLDTRR